MGFFRDKPEPRMDGPVDMDELTQRLRGVPPLERPAHEFVPRSRSLQRVEDAIEHVESFLALPLKQIDDAMAVLKAEYEAAMAEGQTIRDTIMSVQKDYLTQIERRRKLTGISKETFATLKQRYAALDAPPEDEPHDDAPAADAEHERTEPAAA
jgi:hypothetical protein